MFHSTMLKASGNVYIWYEIRKSVVGALNADEINPAPLFWMIVCISESWFIDRWELLI